MDIPGPTADSRYALALDPREVQRYRYMAERARESEADLWPRAGIVPGARVADVGCGPGAMTLALGEAVGPTGHVEAVDADLSAVATARTLLAAAGMEQAAVREGRAEDTGLEPDSFDVVMLRHVLAHNGGREDTIVAHVAGLARPGGCVYLVDAVGTAARTLPSHPDLDDLAHRYVAFHQARGNDVEPGLRLALRLRRAGLEVLEFRGTYQIGPVAPGIRPPAWAAREALVATGFATPADLDRWNAAFEQWDAAPDRPTFFIPMFVAVGRRTR